MKKSWHKLLSEKYVEIPFSEYFKRIGTSFENIMADMGIKKNIKKIKREYFKNSLQFKDKIKAYKTVNTTLLNLQKKYILGVVTSKRKKKYKILFKKILSKSKFFFGLCTFAKIKIKTSSRPFKICF